VRATLEEMLSLLPRHGSKYKGGGVKVDEIQRQEDLERGDICTFGLRHDLGHCNKKTSPRKSHSSAVQSERGLQQQQPGSAVTGTCIPCLA
jgi:hypothetical protein